MGNVTVDSEKIVLLDLLPGEPNLHMGPPMDGFLGAEHHNVIANKYQVGTKIHVVNHSAKAGVDGGSTFVYGKLESQDAANVVAARHLCVWHTDAVPFDFTNDAGADLGAGMSPVVIALSAMTTGHYGWFWCGGVCPEEWVSALNGVYFCSVAAALGPVTAGDLDTPGTVAGEIGFKTPTAATNLIVAILQAAAA